MTTSTASPAARRPPVLLDLDGVVWLARRAIPGSVEAIAALRERGHRVLFVTNNSQSRLADQEAALAAIGVPAEGDVLTSAVAAARLVGPGERAVVCGGDGIVEALGGAGVHVVARTQVDEPPPDADVVVVGFHRDFDYDGLRRAAAAVRAGARLVGTNDDATYPTPDGEIPGGGSILAAVATAAGVTPVVAGKPHEPMAALVRAVVGDDAATQAVMVGDRPDTDGRFARRLGARFALVWTGVTPRGAVTDPVPDLAGDDLRAIAAALAAEAP